MISQIKEKWNNICQKINFDELENRAYELFGMMGSVSPSSDEYVRVMREYSKINYKLSERAGILDCIKDVEVLEELMDESPLEFQEEYEKATTAVLQILEDMEFELLFNDKYDDEGAFLTIHAGSGGVEAQDWAETMSRMYLRWAERHGFKASVVDSLGGDTAGIKSMMIRIDGDYVYGKLKGEHGVHRRVRVSPYDSKNRRHTSFTAIEVLPIIDVDNSIKLDWSEIEMQTFRSGGPGGQYQNTTDSGVRLIHKPTGIVAESRQERSQIQNRATCESVLMAKLALLEEEKVQNEIDELRGDQNDAAWGHSIRSYVYMPYQMVKDNRSGYETGRLNDVLDGDIDDLIKEYLLRC